jgi:protein-L-isoaspartate(D-aspartate) O-methyltransferase
VRVVLADAEDGVPDGAPYDRIVVTAGAWDIPPAWISQLSGPDGRLVVPLRLRGLTRTVVFERDASGLASLHYQRRHDRQRGQEPSRHTARAG